MKVWWLGSPTMYECWRLHPGGDWLLHPGWGVDPNYTYTSPTCWKAFLLIMNLFRDVRELVLSESPFPKQNTRSVSPEAQQQWITNSWKKMIEQPYYNRLLGPGCAAAKDNIFPESWNHIPKYQKSPFWWPFFPSQKSNRDAQPVPKGSFSASFKAQWSLAPATESTA